ncbi:MAG TPA: DUF6798 domain-containing protein [Pseudobdellovibrionaceae bacterium]
MFYFVFFLFILIPVLRLGYHFGNLDHTILSLQGIAKARPTAFLNDWFIKNAPQPHWHFDLLTQAGESLGLLHEFYLLYWFFSVGILVCALKLICQHLKIEKALPWIALILLLGPWRFLGSGPLWGSWALPHFMGGSLGLLACALWLQKKEKWLWFVVPLATLFHIQHGALVSLLLVSGSLFQWRKNLPVICLAILNLGGVFAAAKLRGLTDSGNAFLMSCQKYIPEHCFAPAWPLDWLLPLVVIFIVFIFLGKKIWRDGGDSWTALALSASCITFFGTLIDYFDIEPLATLFRRLFFHRVAAYSLCFAVVIIAQMIWEGDLRNLQNKTLKIFAAISIVILLISPSGILGEKADLRKLTANQPVYEILGHHLETLVPPGEIIAMNPALVWVRLLSRRAVVVDVKAIPFQDQPFKEWEERIRDLGGFDFDGNKFKQMSFYQLKFMSQKYKASFVLLEIDDQKLENAKKEFRFVATVGGIFVLFSTQ